MMAPTKMLVAAAAVYACMSGAGARVSLSGLIGGRALTAKNSSHLAAWLLSKYGSGKVTVSSQSRIQPEEEEEVVPALPPMMEDDNESEVVEVEASLPTTTTSAATGSMEPEDNIGRASTGCSDPMVVDMIAMDNADRGDAGIGPLQCNDDMSAIAVEHSKSQCDRQSMDHEGMNLGSGSLCEGGRCQQIQDLGFGPSAENVLVNPKNLNEFVTYAHDEQWMKSQGHHDNIMDPAFTVVGYGFYTCKNWGSESSGNHEYPATYATGLYAA